MISTLPLLIELADRKDCACRADGACMFHRSVVLAKSGAIAQECTNCGIKFGLSTLCCTKCWELNTLKPVYRTN